MANGFMVWLLTEDDLDQVELHGDKITQVCLFFQDIQADGSLTDSIPNINRAMNKAHQVAQKWPHIYWLVTVKNDGIQSRIDPLVRNDPGVRARFFSDLDAFLDAHSWVDGVDNDLERLDNNTEADIYDLVGEISQHIRARSTANHVGFDLPPMTGPHQTVGAEKWCDYSKFEPLADTIQIMTYGFAWNGSAPAPVSPVSWVRDVMDYAVSALTPSKVYLGVASYGIRWQIYDYPDNLGSPYRGASGGFDPFLRWMIGEYSHTDQFRTGTFTQPFIPFVSFYEEEDWVQRTLLHVYDYPGATEQDSLVAPLEEGDFQGRDFLTAFGPRQRTEFGTIVASKSGDEFDSFTGNLVVVPESGAVLPNPDGTATYTFNVPSTGTYDVVMSMNYPWWGRDQLVFNLDGTNYTVGTNLQWYPYRTRVHWVGLVRKSLSAGSHTLILDGDAAASRAKTQFLGFRVATSFSQRLSHGSAKFTVSPRRFLDVNRTLVWPHQNKFKVTSEVLKRVPQTAQIWNDDFRGQGNELSTAYYDVISGTWTPHDQPLEHWVSSTGAGEFRMTDVTFTDVEVYTEVRMYAAGRAGVTFGDLFLCANTSTNRLELWRGGVLVHSNSSGSYAVGAKHTFALRIGGSTAAAFINDQLWFTYNYGSTIGAKPVGIKVDKRTDVYVLRVGETYRLSPREALTITVPGKSPQQLGRIPRTYAWDSEWNVFKATDMDEPSSRLAPSDGMPTTITRDWDYLHSSEFTLAGPGDYEIEVQMDDVGLWLSTLYLGDADGFSLSYWPDGYTIARFAELAAFEYGVAGMGMWRLGFEDPAVWPQLVSHGGSS